MAENQPAWRKLPATQKQIDAILNMRHALGMRCDALHKMPAERGPASDEIKKLHHIIINNLSIGGSIDPRRSVYSNDSSEWDYEQD